MRSEDSGVKLTKCSFAGKDSFEIWYEDILELSEIEILQVIIKFRVWQLQHGITRKDNISEAKLSLRQSSHVLVASTHANDAYVNKLWPTRLWFKSGQAIDQLNKPFNTVDNYFAAQDGFYWKGWKSCRRCKEKPKSIEEKDWTNIWEPWEYVHNVWDLCFETVAPFSEVFLHDFRCASLYFDLRATL